MPPVEKYSIVSQTPGAAPFTFRAYTGTDLSQVIGIIPVTIPEGYCGWVQSSGELLVRVGGETHAAYADFEPNNAKLHLSTQSTEDSEDGPPKAPSVGQEDRSIARKRQQRLSLLPPLLMEVGPYCKLLREGRDVFVDGHFYACVAMCGISFERFQRDKAKPYGATRKHKTWEIRGMLQKKKVLKPETFDLCKTMADLRNEYAHGDGQNPDKDAFKALEWVHRLINNETALMRDYEVVDGVLHRKRPVAFPR